MTSGCEGEPKRYSSDASRRFAAQTRERARRERLEKDRLRLKRLGVDPAWLERVFPRE